MEKKKRYWWQPFSLFILGLIGWELVDEKPPTQKYVLIGAPHTSNWDWVFALLVMAGLGVRPRWVGKESLFRGIMGPIMRAFGGISVVRGARKNFVGQIIDFYDEREKLVIALAPEGTRKYVDHWKSGFYYIAQGAQVPVAMGFVNYVERKCGICGYFTPSGSLDADIKILQEFYAKNAKGKFEEGQSLVRFKNKD
ncbi:MAG: glycerol acyltransferase [Anaerolineae bacterium]|nr:glycerol acyltransferase [Anaerolineae bacterium]